MFVFDSEFIPKVSINERQKLTVLRVPKSSGFFHLYGLSEFILSRIHKTQKSNILSMSHLINVLSLESFYFIEFLRHRKQIKQVRQGCQIQF